MWLFLTFKLFSKSNFSVPQSELEVFAKSKGIFKNQLIVSINEACYNLLDDVLIEEEDDYYTINTNYFQRISVKKNCKFLLETYKKQKINAIFVCKKIVFFGGANTHQGITLPFNPIL